MDYLVKALVGIVFLAVAFSPSIIPSSSAVSIPVWLRVIAGLLGLRFLFGKLIGIISIILGIGAFFSLLIPFLGFIGVPLGVALILLGIFMLI